LPYQARALHLDKEGRGEEALADFRKAQSLDPADAMVANGVAICLGRLGRVAESMAAFDAALSLNPGLVTTHFHRGWILEMNRDLSAARQSYRRALELVPDYAAAWAGLASAAEADGDWNETRRAATGALALNPDQPRVILSLAYAAMQAQDFALAERHLRAALDRRGFVPSALRTSMWGLLADSLDRQDKTAAAFAAYTAENHERLGLYRASHPAWDMAPLVRRIAAHFNGSYPQDWRLGGAAPESRTCREHVFLLGFPRSGTTLLEQILAAHPEVETLGESDVLDSAAEEFLRDDAGLDRLAALAGDELARARDAYWARAQNHGASVKGKVIIDKLPLNTIKLPLIAKFFPAAKIVFALRDPRDVVFSCFRRHFQVNASTSAFLTLEGAARYYDDVMRLGEAARARLPLAFYLYRHEALVGDFEGELRRLCGFIGLDWTDRFHDFAALARGRTINSISAEQVRRGLYGDGADQWRRYAPQLAPILPLLRHWVEAFGYAPD
jgi:tetratricopeptide (TPR) repeat protein